MAMCLRSPGSLGCGRQDTGKTECVCVWNVGACFHRGPVPVPQDSCGSNQLPLPQDYSLRVFTGPSWLSPLLGDEAGQGPHPLLVVCGAFSGRSFPLLTLQEQALGFLSSICEHRVSVTPSINIISPSHWFCSSPDLPPSPQLCILAASSEARSCRIGEGGMEPFELDLETCLQASSTL